MVKDYKQLPNSDTVEKGNCDVKSEDIYSFNLCGKVTSVDKPDNVQDLQLENNLLPGNMKSVMSFNFAL